LYFGKLYFEGVYEVLPGRVWQASLIGEYRAAIKHFGLTALIELDGWPQDPKPCPLELSWPIDDCDELPDMEEGLRVARTGADWVRSGEKLLVTCFGGQNRSGLVCGLVLWELGVGSGEEIFQMIKDANPDALWRHCFKQHIRSLPRH